MYFLVRDCSVAMLHVASCNLYNATFLSDMIDENLCYDRAYLCKHKRFINALNCDIFRLLAALGSPYKPIVSMNISSV